MPAFLGLTIGEVFLYALDKIIAMLTSKFSKGYLSNSLRRKKKNAFQNT
jgi:hypothetical protein